MRRMVTGEIDTDAGFLLSCDSIRERDLSAVARSLSREIGADADRRPLPQPVGRWENDDIDADRRRHGVSGRTTG